MRYATKAEWAEAKAADCAEQARLVLRDIRSEPYSARQWAHRNDAHLRYLVDEGRFRRMAAAYRARGV